jgi:hypothetical protein
MSHLAHATEVSDPGFDGLVRKGIALLPAHAGEWTNHNASDPGITLIELLAYFADVLMYRLGRVDTATRIEFLHLLRGHAGAASSDGLSALDPAAVDAAIAHALDALSQCDCAVTAADHERLAQRALAALPGGDRARVRCLDRTDLARTSASVETFAVGEDDGHVSVVVFPPSECPRDVTMQMMAAVRHALEERRLLGSHVHVVEPTTIYLCIEAWIAPCPGADREALARRIADTMSAWIPACCAEVLDGTLALSEISDRIAGMEQVEGVERIALLELTDRRDRLHSDASAVGLQIGMHSTIGKDSVLSGLPPVTRERLVRDGDGELAGIAMLPWEVPRIVMTPGDVRWLDAPGARRGR